MNIAEIVSPCCDGPELHLVNISQSDEDHRNKIDLLFWCDACHEPTQFRVRGHVGVNAKALYSLTDAKTPDKKRLIELMNGVIYEMQGSLWISPSSNL